MIDYKAIGLKSGLEIHQQLSSRTKLYCCCPNEIRKAEESDFEFFRYLRARESEMGEVDRAAAEQAMTRKKFIYKSYDTTCLIENDEEPPMPLNSEALDIALKAAVLFNMKPADEVFTMRKIVVDGSNTTGFQRTCFVASNGFIETPMGRVGMDTLCLEEDAASKVDTKADATTYSLDRLGIPLIEIATAPDIKTPAQAREVALAIGTLLRSLKVRRGLGTIRQDVNVSIAQGARVEIKGVQALDLVQDVVEKEAARQVNLVAIREELLARHATVHDEIVDMTDLFKGSESKVVKKALSVRRRHLRHKAGWLQRPDRTGNTAREAPGDRVLRSREARGRRGRHLPHRRAAELWHHPGRGRCSQIEARARRERRVRAGSRYED